MEKIEQLLNGTFPFVEKLMEEFGEFYPLASAMKNDNSIVPVATYYGDDFPKSSDLLEKLKESFVAKKEDYKAVIIVYDVKVINPYTNIRTNAIAVLAEEKQEDISFSFFYPYSIKNTEIEFSEPWKTQKEKEIFK